MAKLDLSGHTGDLGGIKVKTGSYVVAGKTIQRKTNSNRKTKIALTFHVLKAYAESNKAAVGSAYGIDMWSDWTKTYNSQQLAALLIAHNTPAEVMAQFDPDDDELMAHYLTGKPIAMQIEVSTREGTGGRNFTDVNLRQAKALDAATAKVFTDAPDWSKIVAADVSARVLEHEITGAAKSGGGSGGGGGGGNDSGGGGTVSDPFEDPPF